MPDPVVEELHPAREEEWRSFLERQPAGNFYHTLPWRDFVADIFGHRPVYLVARRGGRTEGIFPLFLVRHPIFGRKLLSLPYEPASGGPLAETPEAARALLDAAVARADRERVRYLELRGPAASPLLESRPGLLRSEPILVSRTDLADGEGVWSRVHRGQRHASRQAGRRGLTVRDAESMEDVEAFRRVYLRVFRALGTPPYGSRYFRELWRRREILRGVRFVTAWAGGECVAGAVLFAGGRHLIGKVSACLPEATELRAYPALYAHILRLAIAEGRETVSWGATHRSQTGILAFKERWAAESRPAVFYDLPVRGRAPSVEKLFAEGGLHRAVWRRLPLPVTALLGPPLNRWFC